MITIKSPELELQAAKEANAQLLEQLHELQAECQRNDMAANVTNDAYISEQKHAEELAAALEHVSVKWLQLHMALSEALGLECLPDEDIERYTERIAAMKVTLEPFAAAYDVYALAWGHDMHPDLDLTEISNARYSKVLTFGEFQAAKKAYSGDVH